jgi:hypothetical protein
MPYTFDSYENLVRAALFCANLGSNCEERYYSRAVTNLLLESSNPSFEVIELDNSITIELYLYIHNARSGVEYV